MESKINKGLFSVFEREFRWILREPSFILMTIVLPLLMFFLFISMFSAGVPRDIPIGIYDADKSNLSRELTRRIDAVASVKITANVTSLEEGKRLITQGKIYGLVYIQKGFEKNMLRGLSSQVIHYYNNENQLVGGTLYKDITNTIRIFSGEILHNNLLKSKLSESQAEAVVEPIRVNAHVLFNPYTNYMYYLLSGILPTMLQFFIILCTIYSIGIEIKKGTIAEAMEYGGGNIIKVLSGKLLPYTIIFSLMGMLMLSLMFKYLKFPLQGNIHIIIVSTIIFVLAYQAVGLFYIALGGNILKSLLSAAFYASSAFTFTGITYPMVTMYWPAQLWGKLLPLTHYLNIIVEQALRGTPVDITFKSVFYLTLFLLLPFFLLPRFRQLFTDESLWGDWGSL